MLKKQKHSVYLVQVARMSNEVQFGTTVVLRCIYLGRSSYFISRMYINVTGRAIVVDHGGIARQAYQAPRDAAVDRSGNQLWFIHVAVEPSWSTMVVRAQILTSYPLFSFS